MSFKSVERGELHPRNRHHGRYDLEKLAQANPDLSKYIIRNKYGNETIDFFSSEAVKALNKAILALYYDVKVWDIPSTSLVPPIPGRADYIHYLADIIGDKSGVRCLDIGVGANCIYPIIGVREYGWTFVGSDISAESLKNASKIIDGNDSLRGYIELRHQEDPKLIFEGVIKAGEVFDIMLCNPPFHDSSKSAEAGTMRKLRNLKRGKVGVEKRTRPELNFGGDANELWCEGGELQFIKCMIRESRQFRASCKIFTTLVSKESNLPALYRELSKVGVAEHRIIEMSQGSKRSRILAWRY